MAGEEKGLNNTAIVLMVCTALLFDVLQWLLAFILMDWLAGFFALLTFYVWFKMRGMSFMKPKRLLTFGGASLIEIIPWLSALPAWTAAIVVLALDSKIKKLVPGANTGKSEMVGAALAGRTNKAQGPPRLPAPQFASERQEKPGRIPLQTRAYEIKPPLLDNEVLPNTTAKEPLKFKESEKVEQPEIRKIEANQETVENKNERYREKITNPEATKIIDQNSEQFRSKLKVFEGKVSTIEQGGSITAEEAKEIIRERDEIAGTLMYGQERGRSFKHIRDLGEVQKELEQTHPYWNQLTDEDRKEVLKNERDKDVGEQEASLFAIGVKQEDVDQFLRTQEKLTARLEKTGLKTEPDITQRDFETARYRAYYEARRTSQDVFTHVSDPESIKK